MQEIMQLYNEYYTRQERIPVCAFRMKWVLTLGKKCGIIYHT